MIHDRSRVEDVYRHPVGRDVIDKILLQINRPTWLVTNPLLKRMRLSTLKKLLKRHVAEDFWTSAYELLNSEPDVPDTASGPVKRSWWKEAVFYQVYPRSFCDSNDDGLGDLAGIYSKLDYLQALGVDALWLSPIYDSPNDDNGYDIRDYYRILAEMGTMEDFDRLLAELHRRGMRLIMDLVVNHTSDEHPWFQAALEDPDGPYAPYYFLVDGEADAVPNNWLSFFSGSAWRWFPKIKRHALHLFSSKQMDLNWDHEPLRQDIYKMVRWWLNKGVDGFRLDVINYISKRKGLPDGNRVIGELMQFYGIENYYYGPNLHRYLRELRAEAFEPYQAFSVGETPGVGIEMGRLLTAEGRGELDLIFNFDQLEMPGKVRFDRYRYDLNYLKQYYIKYHSRLGAEDWMSVFWDNHDNPRMLSKVDYYAVWRERLAKLLLTMQLTLKGTVFLYQGQELGAINQEFQHISDFRDVETMNKYAELLAEASEDDAWQTILAGSRDHARVPIRWTADELGGFSDTEAWLPWPESDPGWSVEEQNRDPDSVLAYARACISLRRAHVALRFGNINFWDTKRKDYFAYYRELDGQRLFCEFNLSEQVIARNLPEEPLTYLLGNIHSGGALPPTEQPDHKLEPYEARVYGLHG